MLLGCIIITIVMVVLLIIAFIRSTKRNRSKNTKGGICMKGGELPNDRQIEIFFTACAHPENPANNTTIQSFIDVMENDKDKVFIAIYLLSHKNIPERAKFFLWKLLTEDGDFIRFCVFRNPETVARITIDPGRYTAMFTEILTRDYLPMLLTPAALNYANMNDPLYKYYLRLVIYISIGNIISTQENAIPDILGLDVLYGGIVTMINTSYDLGITILDTFCDGISTALNAIVCNQYMGIVTPIVEYVRVLIFNIVQAPPSDNLNIMCPIWKGLNDILCIVIFAKSDTVDAAIAYERAIINAIQGSEEKLREMIPSILNVCDTIITLPGVDFRDRIYQEILVQLFAYILTVYGVLNTEFYANKYNVINFMDSLIPLSQLMLSLCSSFA